MKPRSGLLFKIAKAIIATCETESELRYAISLLRSPEDLDRLARALETLVTQTRSPGAMGADRDDEKRQAEKKLALITKLRNEGFTAGDTEALIAKVFGCHISSAKMGIDRYVERLSRSPAFGEIYDYLMSERVRRSTSEDPWLREMLNQQEKRDDEHK